MIQEFGKFGPPPPCAKARAERENELLRGEPENGRFRPDPKLSGVVDAIVDSYDVHGGINHIEGPNLPSKDAVISIVNDLERLVFPGYFGEPVNSVELAYAVGALVASLNERLSIEIAKSLRHECRTGRRCQRSEGECTYEARDITQAFLGAIPAIREVLKTDVDAHYNGDPAAKSVAEVLVSYPGLHAIAVHRMAHHLYQAHVPLIPRMMSEYLHGKTGIDIHPGATIGSGMFIDHGTGVVIGETSVIGNCCKIYQGVTLGALSVRKSDLDSGVKRHPTLEDNVTIYSGATILGGETVVGEGSIIGGNVWLTHSVPPGTKVLIDAPMQTFRSRRGKSPSEKKYDHYIPDWEI